MIRTLVVIMLLAHFLPGNARRMDMSSIDTADFTLVKAARGIALYERWYTVTSTVSAREIKATFTVRTEPAAALALLRNDMKGELWNKNANTYEVVDIREHSWVSYIQYDLPWPLKNQDCVLEYNIRGEPDNLRITFRNIDHTAFPVKNRVQRIPDIRGRWILRALDGKVLVEYYISTKPSKTLPGWITDPIIRNNLLETVDAFRATLENAG